MHRFTVDIHSQLARQIKRHEGLKLTAYRCGSGALTVGYGHNCDASPVPGVSRVGDTITMAEAVKLFEDDLIAAVANVRRVLPWVAELDAPRQAVLYDMAFNMGLGSVKPPRGLLSFANTLPMIEDGRYTEASRNMLNSKWARQVKDRAVRLARQMEKGEWQ